MFQIPGFMLKQLYVAGSLANTDSSFRFEVTNPFVDGTITQVLKVAVDGQEFDLECVVAEQRPASEVSLDAPLGFSRGVRLGVEVVGWRLEPGEHNLYLKVETAEFGPMKIDVRDRLS